MEQPPSSLNDLDGAPRHVVWLLPKFKLAEAPFVRQRITKLGVLADGNNRDGGNYDKGGANVVDLAERLLLEDTDLSTFLACIVSPENAEKRSETFFEKMRQAFFMFGLRLVLKRNLGGKGVGLEFEGDLEGFPPGRGVQEFLSMAKAVQGINQELLKDYKALEPDAPPKTLILGINYAPDVLQRRGIEVLYRSGMEEAHVGRFGSTRPDEGVHVAADMTLWPRVTPEHLKEVLWHAAHQGQGHFEAGYSASDFAAFMDQSTSLTEAEGVAVCIPYVGSQEELEALLQERSSSGLYVEYHGEDGALSYGSPQSAWHFTALSPHAISSLPVDAVVAPGQLQRTYHLPSPTQVDVNYANVFQSKDDPSSVMQRVQDAVHFARTHTSLKGAERPSSASVGPEVEVTERPEFTHYGFLKEYLRDRTVDLEALALGLTVNGDALEHYNSVADLFACEMMNWVDELKVPWTKDVEYRAMFNYLFTGFFLSAAPQDAQSTERRNESLLVEGWREGAQATARYMALVYLMDDRIYDAKVEDPAEKRRLIDVGTEQLSRAVEFKALDKDLRPIPQGEMVQAIAQGFQDLAKDLAAQSSPEHFRAWQECILHLFHCHREEWAQSVTDNRLVEDLTDPEKEALPAFWDRYSKAKISPFMHEKIEHALARIQEGEAVERQEGLADLKLWTYLCDIENSIGSALVYRTLACVNSKDCAEEPELAEAYEELCFLINIYFRLANDFAEIYRADDDREENLDSCHLMYKKHRLTKGPDEALIHGAAEVYRLVEGFKKEIVAKRTAFQARCVGKKPWEAVARAITRSDIGELFYKDTHYREARREHVSAFFRQLYALGC